MVEVQVLDVVITTEEVLVVSVEEEVLAAEVLEAKEVQHQDQVVVLLGQEANPEVQLQEKVDLVEEELQEKAVLEEANLLIEHQETKDVQVLQLVQPSQVLIDRKDQEEAKFFRIYNVKALKLIFSRLF